MFFNCIVQYQWYYQTITDMLFQEYTTCVTYFLIGKDSLQIINSNALEITPQGVHLAEKCLVWNILWAHHKHEHVTTTKVKFVLPGSHWNSFTTVIPPFCSWFCKICAMVFCLLSWNCECVRHIMPQSPACRATMFARQMCCMIIRESSITTGHCTLYATRLSMSNTVCHIEAPYL
jgi:hypothetical protein